MATVTTAAPFVPATDDLDVRRVTLTTPDGVLVADLPGHERTTIRICAELGLTKET